MDALDTNGHSDDGVVADTESPVPLSNLLMALEEQRRTATVMSAAELVPPHAMDAERAFSNITRFENLVSEGSGCAP
jgi:hypothetical protein